MNQGIVISGMGFVSVLGVTLSDIWSKLQEGVSGFSQHDDLCTVDGRCGLAGIVPDDVINGLVPAAKFRRLPRESKLTAAAVSQCLKDLPLREMPKGFLESRVGIFMGTGRGPLESLERIGLKLVEGNPKGVNPLDFQETVYNAPLGHVSVHYGIRGPCIALSSGNTSGLAAMEMAANFLAKGEIDLALVGGVESISPFYYKGMSDLNVLSPTYGSREESSPFARDRNGFILSEGAVFLALEREDVSRSRNGKRYACLVGVASACDAYCFYGNDPDGRGFQLAMENCLEASRLKPSDIELILAAASGLDQLDRAEASGIRRVWGEQSREVPVTALKGVFGDIGAASSLLACAVGCEIFGRGVIPATLPDRETDPDFALNVLRNPLERVVRTIMINEASWGGLNSSVILQRVS